MWFEGDQMLLPPPMDEAVAARLLLPHPPTDESLGSTIGDQMLLPNAVRPRYAISSSSGDTKDPLCHIFALLPELVM